ncbi:hypothetical protein [Endozoicomonas sp. SCSIO W0465]|nr:hypothetical protein [Endozoicomonas sp. SCSIO W0465]USE35643.1 hypothetical protein MJO57_26795 [Endozoicomonas sp. SCSIO W0465]
MIFVYLARDDARTLLTKEEALVAISKVMARQLAFEGRGKWQKHRLSIVS